MRINCLCDVASTYDYNSNSLWKSLFLTESRSNWDLSLLRDVWNALSVFRHRSEIWNVDLIVVEVGHSYVEN